MRLVLLLSAMVAPAWDQERILSHPPMRALPEPSKRPRAPGPALFVDAARGEDAGDGSEARPWKRIADALPRLRPGDTLYLRGGVYHEAVALKVSGEAGRPLTIRSYPGELAILDGGLREFREDPAGSWEPVPDGAPGEFRSTKSYPKLGEKVFGNFCDSMIPLHGYRTLLDLRSRNEYWNLTDKLNREESLYCGPGVWLDPASGRIHCRLAHTTLRCLGNDTYRGETDPRKLPLVVAGSVVPLGIDGARHVRVQDLVVRGSSRHTISITGAGDLELDGVVAFGGGTTLYISGTSRLRIENSAFRGISAPWSFRTSHKYRGTAAYLVTVRGEGPPSSDFEIARSEFVDCHDGPFLGTVRRLDFHHNVVDNFNDDGVYLMSMGVGGDLRIHQNLFSRCLTTFSFAGTRPVGSGVWITRNLFDLRGPVPYFQPNGPDDARFASGEIPTHARLASDHGSPTWEPIWFYHNTVLAADPAFRDYYGAGWGGHMKGTSRRVFNNVFVQTLGNPGLAFSAPEETDLQADGNLLWGTKAGPAARDGFFDKFRQSALFKASRARYAPGWGARDLFADPAFVTPGDDWRAPLDARLKPGSPAIDAGVEVPADWPDPLRAADAGRPDIGAFPLGAEPFRPGRR